jgi:hypothetical protein
VFVPFDAFSDQMPKIKADWSFKANTIILRIMNVGANSIQISPKENYQARQMADIGVTDVKKIVFLERNSSVVHVCVVFFMRADHLELASSSRGGSIPPPETIAPGKQDEIPFALDENFSLVAAASDKIKCLLIYNGAIIDVNNLSK